MEINSPPELIALSNSDLVLQRLLRLGVPEDSLNQGQRGLVAYVKSNRYCVRDLVYAILPSNDLEVDEGVFRVSLNWLQWLMFECEPNVALEHLTKMGENERGVCGAVWGNNDIAYRCRTCQHDPTCAICVPCFEGGNHNGHDYSVIYTGGGCCDCGDATAWKREGFCSKHRGAEQIQPLPENFAMPLGPVLDLLLGYWKERLHCAKRVPEESPRAGDSAAELQKAADDLTLAVVSMLLDFCWHSESLLSFIAGRINTSVGLLDALLRAESFMNDNVVGKLHELLLKLLGEPIFKYEFAKVFVSYYPMVVNEAIKESSDSVFKNYPLLSTFSVQILTVPTLTPRLVEEMNLLGMLLQCLENIFVSCAREDGRLQVSKWAPLYETTLRVVEDIRFVMSHSAVPKYLCHKRRDLVKTWMKLLASVQGMNSQRRETGNHIEEENEVVHFPFVLCHSISHILSLLVAGTFSRNSSVNANEETYFNAYEQECDDYDGPRLSKVGRPMQEIYISSITAKSSLNNESEAALYFPIPLSTLSFIHECLISMENWLELDNTVGPLSALSVKADNDSGSNFLALKRTLCKFRKGKYMFKSSSPSSSKLCETLNRQTSSPSVGACNLGVGLDCRQSTGLEASSSFEDGILERESPCDLERIRVLNSSGWPDITFDVSSQDISVNIPLHRLLSMVLRSALKECYGKSVCSSVLSPSSVKKSFTRSDFFFSHILEGCHPFGFSAFVMEHPLRIRVFCAEVHAGMWRRNGDAPILFSEWYRSVRWSEQGQELDLFLLQCCAALAPADLYVRRILERFGLSDYLSLSLELSSKYESILVAEMLILLIQIVKERRFCGLSPIECLQRDLVYKLSIGDVTRSQLIKSLPHDLSKIDKLQELLDTIAEYSHPSGLIQGMYKLRSQYWKELDLYHPRWISRDLQAAEERYLRFCNASALTTQLPRWTKIYHPLIGLAKVATCKTILQIVRAVLFYAAHTPNHAASRAPDGVLLNALHLLALALDVCQVDKESGDQLCYFGDTIPILAFAGEDIPTSKSGDQSLLSLLVLLMKMHERANTENFIKAGNFSLSPLISNLLDKFVQLEPECLAKLQKLVPEWTNRFSDSILYDNIKHTSSSESEKHKARARERQAAILERMKNQQSKFLESFDSSADNEMDDVKSEEEACDSEVSNKSHESAQVSCSLCHDTSSRNPVSYLVLLQKSRLLSFISREPPSWEHVLQSDKLHVSNITSNGVFSSSRSNGSDTFLSSQLVDVLQSALNDFATVGQPGEVGAFMEFVRARFPALKNVQLPSMYKRSPDGSASSLELFEENMYMLIRESQSSLNNSDSPEKCEIFSTIESSMERRNDAGSLLLGKYIAALLKDPLHNPSGSQSVHGIHDRVQSETSAPNLDHAMFGPSGGNGVYVSSCGHAVHKKCLDRYLSTIRERYMRRIVFEGGNIVDTDLGEFLCPVCRGLANAVLPALPGIQRKILQPPVVSTKNFMDVPTNSHDIRLHDAIALIQTAAAVAANDEGLLAFPAQCEKRWPNIDSILCLLIGMYYPNQDNMLHTGRVSRSLILWDTLRYSLMSVEIAARSRKNSLRLNNHLGVLFKELNSSSGFILSLMLNAAQSMRSSSYLTVLLRLRGIQLCSRSLDPNTSPNDSSNNLCQREGNMLYILENSQAEVQYPDTKLWKHLSEPVLASDAFSSLMWTLFCLPWPVLSCKESYFSLVHAFYVVNVTQAVITYCSKRQTTINGLEFHDCLITDILKAVDECREAWQCFDSQDIDSLNGIIDSTRILTFPYLRRCALLWKLINRSNSMPFNHVDHAWDGALYAYGYLECAEGTAEVLSEVEKLEKVFDLPPLGVIVNNKRTRLVALRWVHHFSKVYGTKQSQFPVRCDPAIPFKLMRLPHLYQDLLQMYIKSHCPNCESLKEEPALCLLCGRLCSPNWKPCCRETECETHAMRCGAGIGVFLLIRRTTILLQRSARQAPWPSPYLDAFGEEDVEMKRGKPLFLNEERYAALSHMVASHGLDRSSKVLRQTMTGTFFAF